MQKRQLNRAALEVLLTKLLLGIAKYFTTPVPVGGLTMSAAQMSAILNACLSAGLALDAAKVDYENKLVAYQAAYKAAHSLWVALIAYLRAAYGEQNPILNEFGVPPTVRAKPTAATMAAAKVKAKATRLARHTMGSKQKAAITGTVTNGSATPTAKA
jgi:hypothetical protein